MVTVVIVALANDAIQLNTILSTSGVPAIWILENWEADGSHHRRWGSVPHPLKGRLSQIAGNQKANDIGSRRDAYVRPDTGAALRTDTYYVPQTVSIPTPPTLERSLPIPGLHARRTSGKTPEWLRPHR